jgi:hypothetical protein
MTRRARCGPGGQPATRAVADLIAVLLQQQAETVAALIRLALACQLAVGLSHLSDGGAAVETKRRERRALGARSAFGAPLVRVEVSIIVPLPVQVACGVEQRTLENNRANLVRLPLPCALWFRSDVVARCGDCQHVVHRDGLLVAVVVVRDIGVAVVDEVLRLRPRGI